MIWGGSLEGEIQVAEGRALDAEVKASKALSELKEARDEMGILEEKVAYEKVATKIQQVKVTKLERESWRWP